MSLVALGIDIVNVAEVRESIERFGSRYLERVYTPGERAYSESSPGECAARLAARFAAKEAVIKVLRPSDEALAWGDIDIVRTPSGACEVRLAGPAREQAERRGIGRVLVSLTHQGSTAAAVAAALALA